MTAQEAKVRVLGLASSEPATRVPHLARSIAEVATHADVNTLLLDLSVQEGDTARVGWVPGNFHAQTLPVRDVAGFDVLFGDPTASARYLFNNVAQLRTSIEQDLSSYGLIVVDLAPIADMPDNAINPMAAALACDGVVLVATLGRVTRAKLLEAMELMRTSGVKLIGSVVRQGPSVRRLAPRGKRRSSTRATQ